MLAVTDSDALLLPAGPAVAAMTTVTAAADLPYVTVSVARPGPLHAEYACAAIAAGASGRLASERVVNARALVTP